MDEFHAEHYPVGSEAVVDQIIAQYRGELTEMVRSCREHFERCDLPACPGYEALDKLTDLVNYRDTGEILAMLVVAVHYLARNEDLLKRDDLEELLSGVIQEGGLRPEQDPEGR